MALNDELQISGGGTPAFVRCLPSGFCLHQEAGLSKADAGQPSSATARKQWKGLSGATKSRTRSPTSSSLLPHPFAPILTFQGQKAEDGARHEKKREEERTVNLQGLK